MRKNKIIGISFLVAGAISFGWAAVVYVNYLNWLEMIREKCSAVPCMTPINNSMDMATLGIIIGSVLSVIGIAFLIIDRKNKK